MSSQYPRDEFDLAGEDMPVGMHRSVPSRWRAIPPFLTILVIVPLLAWGASSYLTHQDTSNSNANSTPTQSNNQVQPTGSQPVSTDQNQSTEEPQPQPSPTEQPQSTSPRPIVDHNVKVSVLNGTNQADLAAARVSDLTNAGLLGATVANANNWASEITVIYYEDPNLEATTKVTGQTLGIDNVCTTTGLGGPDVVVLLRWECAGAFFVRREPLT